MFIVLSLSLTFSNSVWCAEWMLVNGVKSERSVGWLRIREFQRQIGILAFSNDCTIFFFLIANPYIHFV